MMYAARQEFCKDEDRCTNNIAEYEAVLLGLRKIRALGVQSCKVTTGSKVVANQADKEYVAREPMLAKYLLAVRSMDKYFKGFNTEYIERKHNDEADELAKLESCKQQLSPDVFYEVIQDPTIKTVQKEQRLAQAIMSEDWRAR